MFTNFVKLSPKISPFSHTVFCKFAHSAHFPPPATRFFFQPLLTIHLSLCYN